MILENATGFFVIALCLMKAVEMTNDADVNDDGNEENIVGGFTAKIGQFPFQVSIQRYGDHYCGGSIVDKYHVVTAAHCTRWMSNKFKIRAGSNDLKHKQHVLIRNIRTIKAHEHFKSGSNDIALIKVTKPFKFNRFVKPVKLPKRKVNAGTKCNISGWGRLNQSTFEVPTKLHFAIIPIVDINVCKADYMNFSRPVNPQTMICGGYRQGGVDACQGDSGGPLSCRGVLFGIVSWGKGCARPGLPGVYTNVINYKNWLRKHGVKFHVK